MEEPWAKYVDGFPETKTLAAVARTFTRERFRTVKEALYSMAEMAESDTSRRHFKEVLKHALDDDEDDPGCQFCMVNDPLERLGNVVAAVACTSTNCSTRTRTQNDIPY